MNYNRELAVLYAHRWAFKRNPAYFDFSEFGGDCTNFASQCIFSGAPVMNYTPVFGWFYVNSSERTPSWTGVEELYKFLVSNTERGPWGKVVALDEVEPGDIIQLRFPGKKLFSHCPVIVDTGMNTPDTILVSAHSDDSDNRPLSTYNYIDLRPIHICNVSHFS